MTLSISKQAGNQVNQGQNSTEAIQSPRKTHLNHITIKKHLACIMVTQFSKIKQTKMMIIMTMMMKMVFEQHHENTINVVSDQVLHKRSCTSTEDDYRLEIGFRK